MVDFFHLFGKCPSLVMDFKNRVIVPTAIWTASVVGGVFVAAISVFLLKFDDWSSFVLVNKAAVLQFYFENWLWYLFSIHYFITTFTLNVFLYSPSKNVVHGNCREEPQIYLIVVKFFVTGRLVTKR